MAYPKHPSEVKLAFGILGVGLLLGGGIAIVLWGVALVVQLVFGK